MRIVKYKYKEIKVPETASEWELFSSMEGSEKAAKAITRELVRLLGTDLSPDEIFNKMYMDRDAIMNKFIDFGAGDTEPRSNLVWVLQQVDSEFSWW